MLTDILTALCLVMVIEGILPFINPEGYKKTLRFVLQLSNGHLRLFGLSVMIAGVVILTLVR